MIGHSQGYLLLTEMNIHKQGRPTYTNTRLTCKSADLQCCKLAGFKREILSGNFEATLKKTSKNGLIRKLKVKRLCIKLGAEQGVSNSH